MTLTQELWDIQQEIRGFAEGHGRDCFETIFEIVDYAVDLLESFARLQRLIGLLPEFRAPEAKCVGDRISRPDHVHP